MFSFLNIDNPIFALVLLSIAVGAARLSRVTIVPTTVAKTPAVYYETLEGLRGLFPVNIAREGAIENGRPSNPTIPVSPK
jgi:hypothetical protein